MASRETKLDPNLLQATRKLLWGNRVKEEVFSRWSQGFMFSEHEATALIQLEGGPCAVIAPVQTFILKHALFCSEEANGDLNVSEEMAITFLFHGLLEILLQLASDHYIIVTLEKNVNTTVNDNNTQEALQQDGGGTNPKRPRMDKDNFHSYLRCHQCSSTEELKTCMKENLSSFTKEYGVLLYLYSVILSKGIEQIKNEVEDPSESLIDGTYGHGSQSLINLLLTGRAVSNVWDHDKEISGLKMRGIYKQSYIGFLTLLEHLRYCEVGWFLKNPKCPIWLLASETHLTVLFSKEKGIVFPATQEMTAKQVFQKFDNEGNGFISTSSLGQLLQELDLGSEKEFVDVVRNKLDSENLGIITLSSFMQEFYPEEGSQGCPNRFIVFHYNGLSQSCPQTKVAYQEGSITLLVEEEYDMQIVVESTPIKTCLETKWPFIDITWKDNHVPSLN
ncbi:ubiquitin carboxyl-terminal hydrolase MINDY-3-like [Octopus vulgaris]|uniref:Ubiquitin carboxyl-terminal hydrolase MINDY-3-like n=2 Tax=Octopus TaxID=6643 RepID=A0AA36B764_OCTVU|nr:ubiquitin carboxyl-terminal hydrolase MINDY-3 [Octopus sinensis]CAI9728247.1 ubiquitin carboxyl-terminal hydrolase MINDY-3-like [Octopus vulgaris]